jgi:ketosteroid isomerase-like protein
MSANLDALTAFYAAFNRRAFDEAMEYVDPNVEVYPGVMAPDANARYVGHQGFKEFLLGIVVAPWEKVTTDPKQVIEALDGRILSIDEWHFHGRDGIEIERELPNLFTFRGGRIVRSEGFTDRAEALEAAGLSE